MFISLGTWFSFAGLAVLTFPVSAQVVPDASLGTQNTGGNITGGMLTSDGSGQQNLFHSFQAFSLSPTDNITFEATPSIANIITRVTGNSPSNINGTLAVTSSRANFFLLNPSGIVFGPDAKIDLQGSFLATTAEQAIFDNGVFSATDLIAPSPLTISAPIGLQMGTASGTISVNNIGHSLTRLNPQTQKASVFAPHVQLGDTQGIQVHPGQTLALIGNGIQFDGGLVTANSGNIEIGSVAAGNSVSLIPTPTGFAANYEQVENFSAVELSNRSLANVSGVPTRPNPLSPLQIFSTSQGTIQVVGQDVSLQDASVILGQNGVASTTPGGDIRLKATATLSLQGSDALSNVRSGIFSETIGPAVSGDIEVNAANVNMDAGAGVTGFTYSPAASGEVNVQATEQIAVSGFNPLNPFISTAIGTGSSSPGRSGNIQIKAPSILLSSGGTLTSINLDTGSSGDLFVDANDITITGRIAQSDIPSGLSVSNFGFGQAGNINVTTQRLTLEEDGVITASSITDGPAGNINIDASERIDVTTANVRGTLSEVINSSVFRPSSAEQVIFGLPATYIPSGNAGSVTITTPILNLTGPASISVQNVGTGNAGSANINADTVTLRDGSQIGAFTQEGEGGDINLQIQDALILRGASRLSAESGGLGNGGNIAIASPIIIALENSDIIANAVQGRGGNITINSQSVLGTAFRDELTSESDITASSEFGLNGTVEISAPTVDPSSGAVVLETDVVDPDQQVAATCFDNQNNNFIASGRGGLPQSPQVALSPNSPWIDLRPIAAVNQASTDSQPNNTPAAPLTEATSWNHSQNGEIQLLAAETLHSTSASCLHKTHAPVAQTTASQ